MSPLFSLCVLFVSCSAASRSHDFTLCNTLAQWSDVISTPSKYMTTQESLTYLHSLPCLNLCFNRKLLPIPRSRPTFKLALILLLAGDVSLNPGPVVRHNIRLATTNIRSIREKTASHWSYNFQNNRHSRCDWDLAQTACHRRMYCRHLPSWLYLPPSTTSSWTRRRCRFPYFKTI